MPRGRSPHDPLGPQDCKLPTPPQPSRDKKVKESEAQHMAFREAMELSHSSSMSWEDQVQKEEEWQRCDSSDKGSPKLGLPPPVLEEGNTSDVSMVDDSPSSMTQTWLLRRRGKRAWTWMYLLALQPLCL